MQKESPALGAVQKHLREKFGGLGIIIRGQDRIIVISENPLSAMAIRGIESNAGGFAVVYFTKEEYNNRFNK